MDQYIRWISILHTPTRSGSYQVSPMDIGFLLTDMISWHGNDLHALGSTAFGFNVTLIAGCEDCGKSHPPIFIETRWQHFLPMASQRMVLVAGSNRTSTSATH